MNLSVLCSDSNHPVVDKLKRWVDSMFKRGHKVNLAFRSDDLQDGDILFLVSCTEMIGEEVKRKFRSTLVLHASDLPKGKGWSPYIWAILEGSKEITVSLIEADEPIDSGSIWMKERFIVEDHELLPEINKKLFDVEISLMTKAVDKFGTIIPAKQIGDSGKYLPRRKPADSRLDPNKTIAEQFDLLRVVDSQRYPAFLDYRGKRYHIYIQKAEDE